MNENDPIVDPRTSIRETASDTASAIKRALRFLVIATFVVYLGLAGVVLYVYTTTNANHDALCAYRADLHSRLTSGQQFLKDNPNGIPGIPAVTLKTTITNEKRVIKAFSHIKCS